MFVMRLERFDILADAVFLLSEIEPEADLTFSPTLLTLLVSNPTLNFFAMIRMQPAFFQRYTVDHDLSSRICLHSFHSAMWDGGNFSSMAIHVPQDTTTMNLIFETSVLRDAPDVLHHELILLPPEDDHCLDDIVQFKKCFSIDLQNFRHIIRKAAPFQNDSVCVTLTNSQVKFSIASVEIILTQESEQCEIEGHEGEVLETQFRIRLHPMLFFLKMTDQAGEDRIDFYKATNGSFSVIFIPSYGSHVDYLICFPQM